MPRSLTGRSATFGLIGAAVFAEVLVVSGQQPAPGQTRLSTVKRLKCTFTTVAVGTWPATAPEIRVGLPKDVVTLTISDIDLDEGRATILTTPDSRATPVTVQLNGSNLYIFDERPSSVSLTTVFSQVSKNKRLKAVHTQTAPQAAQYAGDCEILR